MEDSLLVIFVKKIDNDLALSEYNISKPSFHSFIGRVYFTPKYFYTFFLFGVTDKMKNKCFKQGKGFRIYLKACITYFTNYIEENKALPYDFIEYFKCQFITSYDDSPEAQAMYGEYKFSVTKEDGFNIIEKKIEVLQGKDAIMRKHKTNF